MKPRDIPTDIAISASFFAVFLLSLIPWVLGLILFSPDLWLLATIAREKRNAGLLREREKQNAPG
jgi:hypothetical protein